MQPLKTLSVLGRKLSQGISYILYDQFTTDRAAGAVNGTQAEPTGGVRTVVDTGNKLSIASGLLTFATGGDSKLWYSLQTRAAGKIILGKVNGSIQGLYVGWDSNQSGIPTDAVDTTGGAFQAMVNGTNVAVGGTLSGGTDYTYSVILRNSGSYFFIKGGLLFTSWTLLFVSTSSSGDVFPMVGNVGTSTVFTADNIRIPTQLWLPAPLAYDTFTRYIAYDTFTRSNGAIRSTETPSDSNQTLTPIAWTGGSIVNNKNVISPSLGSELVVNGDFTSSAGWTLGSGWSIGSGTANAISSNATDLLQAGILTLGRWYMQTWDIVSRSSGGFRTYIGESNPTRSATGSFVDTGRAWWTTLGIQTSLGTTGSLDNVSVKQLTLSSLFSSISTTDNDIIADATITLTSGTQAGIVLNLDSTSSPANFIIAYYDGTNIKLEKCVAGTYTTLISVADSGTSKTLQVVKSGTSYSVYTSGVQKGATQTITDAGIISNTKHGLFSTYASNTFDDFKLQRNNGAIGSTEANSPDGVVAPANPAPVIAWDGTSGSVVSGKGVITPVETELLSNGNMETGSPPTGWTSEGGATLSSEADERTGGSGTKSLGTIRGTFDFVASQNMSPTPVGSWILPNGYGKGTTGALKTQMYLSGNTTAIDVTGSADTWTAMTASFGGVRVYRSTTLNQTAFLYNFGTGGQKVKYDDVSVKLLTLASLFSSVLTSDSDVLADVNITLPSGRYPAGLVLNLDSQSSPANFVIAYHDGTNAKLEKCVAGTYTSLISAAATYSAGATIRVIKYGTNYRLYYANALVGSEQTILDAGIISNTRHGIFSTFNGNQFDNFTLFARGSDNEYSQLDSF